MISLRPAFLLLFQCFSFVLKGKGESKEGSRDPSLGESVEERSISKGVRDKKKNDKQ